jgi:hypothetical protein
MLGMFLGRQACIFAYFDMLLRVFSRFLDQFDGTSDKFGCGGPGESQGDDLAGRRLQGQKPEDTQGQLVRLAGAGRSLDQQVWREFRVDGINRAWRSWPKLLVSMY